MKKIFLLILVIIVVKIVSGQSNVITDDITICKGTTVTLASNKSWVPNSSFTPAVTALGNVGSKSDIITDKWGNIYVWGVFSGTFNFGSSTLVSVGSQDLFLAKYDQKGNKLWALKAGTALGTDNTYHDSGKKLATDSLGNIYVLGNYLAEFSFKGNNASVFTAPYTVSSNSNHSDGFLVKIDSSGTVLWGASLRDGSNDGLNAITVDQKGNPIMVGSFNGCCPSTSNVTVYGPLNSKLMSTTGYGTGFVVKFNQAGNILWTAKVQNRDCTIGAITTDAGSNIYLSAWYSSWTNGTKSTFTDAQNSTHEINNPSNNLTFIAKLNETGTFQWGVPIGAAGNDIGIADMEIDVTGKLWLAGRYTGNPILLYGTNNTTIRASNSAYGDDQKSKGFIAKYSLDGIPILATSFQQYGATVFNGLMVNEYGLLVFGNHEGQNSKGGKDIFMMSYGLDGHWKDTVSAGGANLDEATGVAKYKNSYFFIGQVGGAAKFGDTIINNASTFIWKTGGMFQSDFLENAYSWSTGAKTRTITVTPTVSTDYSVIINDAYGLERKDTISITVTDTLTFNPFPDIISVNNADSVVLNAGAGYAEYQWSNNATTQRILVKATGKYSVTVTTASGCSFTDSTVVANYKKLIQQNDTTICKGASVNLLIDPKINDRSECSTSKLPLSVQNNIAAFYPFCNNANDLSSNTNNGVANGAIIANDKYGNENRAYAFNGTSNIINLNNPFFSGSQQSVFTVSTRVKFNSLANSPNIWGKTSFWGEVNFQVGSDGSINFWWANSYSGNKYSSIYSDANTIQTDKWYDIAIVFENSVGKIYVNGVLVKTNLLWTAQGGGQLSNTQIESRCNFAQDIGSSKFGVRVSGGSNTGYLNGTIDEFAFYDKALNYGEILQLISNTSNVKWSTGDTTSSISVSPSKTTTYYLEIKNGTITQKDSITVTVNETSGFNPLPNITSVNNADSVVLDAGAGYAAYQWSNNTSTQSIVAKEGGTYRITVVNTSGCSASDSTYILFNKLKIFQNDTSICAGSPLTLSIDESFFAKNNIICSGVNLSQNLQKGLVAYFPFCNTPDDQSGNKNNGIAKNIKYDFDRFGNMNSAGLFSSMDSTYISIPAATQFQPNSYTLSAWFNTPVIQYGSLYDQKGQTIANYTPSNWYKSGAYKIGLSAVDNSDFFASMWTSKDSWKTILTKIYPNRWYHSVLTYDSASGFLSLYLNGKLINSIKASIEYNGQIAFMIGADREQLSGEILNFFQGRIDDVAFWNRALSTYEVQELFLTKQNVSWSTGDTSNSITVYPQKNTTYYVTITDGISTSTDSIKVTVLSSNAQILANKDAQCLKGNNFELSISDTTLVGGVKYKWDFGTSSNTTQMKHVIHYDSVGTYNVKLMFRNLYGCLDTLQKRLTVITNPLAPELKASGDTTICEGDSVLLSSSLLTNNQWLRNGAVINNANNNFITVKETGFYQLYVTNELGCNSDTSKVKMVNVFPIPAAPVVKTNKLQPILCAGDTLELSSSIATGNQWFLNRKILQDEVHSSLKITNPGAYSLTTTSKFGCVSKPSVPLEVKSDLNIKPNIIRVQNDLVSSYAPKYKWYYNNFPLSYDTLSNFKIRTSGLYKVATSFNNMCWTMSDPYIVQYAPANQNQQMALDLSAYPNPALSLFYLQIKLKQRYSGFVQITIVDAGGNTRWAYNKYVFNDMLVRIPINLNGNKGLFTVKVMVNGYAPKAIQVIGM